MTPQEIIDTLKLKFGEVILDGKAEGVLDPFVKISAPAWLDVATVLRDEESLKCNYLMCLSGVDYGKGMLGVVSHIASIPFRHKITVKIEIPKDQPNVPSVSSIWRTANWHEREAFDMFGIRFLGHPDMRRILLPDDWEGHPLRKDFKVPEFYRGMKVPY